MALGTLNDNDTIAAISTGISAGGIGIIRLSGNDAVSIADRIFKSASNKKISEVPSHTIHYGHIIKDEKALDEVLLSVMKAPKTYTGEDVVEINCHGGLFVMQKILEYVVKSGARLADPGEFTKRAFINGRIDLSEAEAVMDIINSENEYALESSISQLRGAVKEKIEGLRSVILNEMAFIESAIDDPENYDIDSRIPQMKESIQDLLLKIRDTEAAFDEGKILKEGITTVILGKPNVGKSSILNALSGFEKAIVTDIAGTTRDILEEKIRLKGISLKLLDTAGLRNTEDDIEKIGVMRAKEAADKADLILYVADASKKLDEEDIETVKGFGSRPHILIFNKSDLIENDEAAAYPEGILISAKTGEGIEELAEKIREMFFKEQIKTNEQLYITNIRHKELLKKAGDSLELVIKSIENDAPEDFFTIDMMDAYGYLGEIIGADVGEDLINEIFEKFCMGK